MKAPGRANRHTHKCVSSELDTLALCRKDDTLNINKSDTKKIFEKSRNEVKKVCLKNTAL